jgi:hypothetical protein
MPVPQDNDGDRLIKAAFAHLDPVAFGVAVGLLLAAAIWGATAFLLLKGAPAGQHVGTHLGLLSNYLPLYSVSWSGSVVGLVHGLWIGFGLGAFLAAAWNLPHHVWLMLLVRRNMAGQQL